MHPQCTTTADDSAILAHVPLAGRLLPATQVCAGLAYARVSKSIQTTIPAQLEEITRLASKLHVPLMRALSDTGSGMKADREGYQTLLEEATSGRYSHVLLFRADRLARDSAELQTTIKRLWKHGLTVHDTSVGEITQQNLPLLALLAEMEIQTLSGRTDMGLRYAADQGHKLGGLPLGYNKGDVPGHPAIDPVLGPAITKLFERAATGSSFGTLQALYEEETGRRIDRRTIKRALSNPYYAGVVVNFRTRDSILHGSRVRDREEWVQTTHSQPLTDTTTWLDVQERLAHHANVGQHRTKQSRYPLQGLIWCSRCNRRMEGQPGGGTRGTRYRCPLCLATRSTRKVEAAVRRALDYAVLTDEDEMRARAEASERQRDQAAAELAAATAHIERLTLQRQRLYQRLDEGIIDTEQYRAQVAVLDAERAAWEQRQGAYKKELARVLVPHVQSDIDWSRWTELLETKDVEGQQRVYRHCCAAIRLDAAANTVTVRYTPQVFYLVRAEERTESL